MKTLLTIAGVDSLGCSGVHQDQRAAQAQGVHLTSVVSAVTAQNHHRFVSLAPIPNQIVMDQLEAVFEEVAVDAIKIGLLPSVDMIRLLGKRLQDCKIPLVLDPIMGPSSLGTPLVADARDAFWNSLIPIATLVTPNIPELSWLLNRDIKSRDDIKAAAQAIVGQGCQAVLIKGGHGEEDEVADYLFDGEKGIWLTHSRLPHRYRGTGCYLSAAIGSALSRGFPTREAILEGKTHLMQAFADSYPYSDQRILLESEAPKALPTINTFELGQSTKFPSIGADAIGFYPVFPNLSWLERMVPLGIQTVQLRIKNEGLEEVRRQIKAAVDLCNHHGCRLFVNDYWQVAMEEGAYGVHLGQEDLDSADITKIEQSGLRLGISTHSLEELGRALTLQPSYIALGPVFPTTCKSMKFGPQGIERVGDWVRLSPVPVVAIGGLKPEHSQAVLQQGASGIALISDVTEDPNPEERVKLWLDLIGR